MVNPLKNRTVTPDGRAIQCLRIEKGWRVEDLAEKAKCSLKTVENVERGANVYVYTLNKFAKALGVEVSTLMIGTEPPDPPKKERCFKVQFTLEIPYEEFDESEQLVSFVAMLKQIVQAKHEITVAGVAKGSTIITLEMSMDDIKTLVSEYWGSHARPGLDVFRVRWLKLPDSEDFTLTESGVEMDEETGEPREFEKPLRGSRYYRGLPKSAPKPPAATEQRPPEQEEIDPSHGVIGQEPPPPIKMPPHRTPWEILEGLPPGFMEPPVPEHQRTHPDEDEDE
jgi:transcriptional regulator with XRE-family HTH domain